MRNENEKKMGGGNLKTQNGKNAKGKGTSWRRGGKGGEGSGGASKKHKHKHKNAVEEQNNVNLYRRK